MPLYTVEQQKELPKRFSSFFSLIEKNSKIVIIVSVVVIIVSCALIAQILVSSKKQAQLLSELESANFVAALQHMRGKFEKSALHPHFLYKCGRLAYEEGNYSEARSYLKEFIDRYRDHPLFPKANGLYSMVLDDLTFIEKESGIYSQQFYLTSHPQLVDVQKEMMYAPHSPVFPKVSFELEKGSFEFELYCWELASTSDLIVQTLSQEGIKEKITVKGDDNAAEIMINKEGLQSAPLDNTERKIEKGSVLLELKDGAAPIGKIIVVKNPENFKKSEYQLIGKITFGSSVVDELKDSQQIKAVSIK